MNYERPWNHTGSVSRDNENPFHHTELCIQRFKRSTTSLKKRQVVLSREVLSFACLVYGPLHEYYTCCRQVEVLDEKNARWSCLQVLSQGATFGVENLYGAGRCRLSVSHVPCIQVSADLANNIQTCSYCTHVE